jgi:hypothetical protein
MPCDCFAQRGGTAHRLDDAAKLAQNHFTGLFEDTSFKLRDKRKEDLGQASAQPGEAASFVAREKRPQAGDKNRRKPTPRAPCRFFRHASPSVVPRNRNIPAPHGNYK